jgi:hypothetical protein
VSQKIGRDVGEPVHRRHHNQTFCDGHHSRAVSWFTVATRSFSQCGGTNWLPLVWMEKIMRKTNDNSNTLEHHDALADSELDATTGGWFGQWINGGGTTTSGLGNGIRGESSDILHRHIEYIDYSY